MEIGNLSDLISAIVSVIALIVTILVEGPRIAKTLRHDNADFVSEKVKQADDSTQKEEIAIPPRRKEKVKAESKFSDKFYWFLNLSIASIVAGLLWGFLNPTSIWTGILFGALSFIVSIQIFVAFYQLTTFVIDWIVVEKISMKDFFIRLAEMLWHNIKYFSLFTGIAGLFWGAAVFWFGGRSLSGGAIGGGGLALLWLLSFFYGLSEESTKKAKIEATFEYEFKDLSQVANAAGKITNIAYVQWLHDAGLRHFHHVKCLHPVQAIGAKWVLHSYSIEYISQAQGDERINIRTWVDYVYSKDLKMGYEYHKALDNTLVARGEMEWFYLDKSGKQSRIPKALKKLIPTMPYEKYK